MKTSVATIRKWVDDISDDYMHFTEEQKEHVIERYRYCDFEALPDDAGCIGWIEGEDFDCKKRICVLILYCRPEKRGRQYLRYMLNRLEEIAREAGATEILIGHSVSGYKEDKFNRMLGYYGFSTREYYTKRI